MMVMSGGDGWRSSGGKVTMAELIHLQAGGEPWKCCSRIKV